MVAGSGVIVSGLVGFMWQALWSHSWSSVEMANEIEIEFEFEIELELEMG